MMPVRRRLANEKADRPDSKNTARTVRTVRMDYRDPTVRGDYTAFAGHAQSNADRGRQLFDRERLFVTFVRGQRGGASTARASAPSRAPTWRTSTSTTMPPSGSCAHR